MLRTEIRLECLKLAHTHGREIAEVVGRASEYEKFVLGEETASEVTETPEPLQKQGPGRPRKKIGNPDILS